MRAFVFALVALLPTMPSALLAAECAPLDPAAFACQDQIAKSGAYYAKAHLGAVQTCLAGFQKGKITGPDAATVCRGTSLASLPSNAKTAGKITNAVTKAVGQIAKKCNDGQVAALGLCAGTVTGLGTCLFAQHFAAVDQAIGSEVGALATTSDAGLQKCQSTIAKESGKYLSARLKAVETCFKARNKLCGTANPMPRCLAAQPAGPKAEAKVATTLDKALAKFSSQVAKSCSDPQVAALDACGDTQSALAACVACSHGNSAETQIAADYQAVLDATTGTGLQPIADLAQNGDTILIEPGTYAETMTLKDSGLTVLGHKSCSTGARPLIENPGTESIGISSCGSLLSGCSDVADNQLLQSLEVNDFGDYDVYTAGAAGVTYRDLVTRGPETTNVTRYGPFPILSNNVLVENCFVSGISDAGIYVGQSTNIVVRNNEVQNSVAGIEIENSANAEVYGNYTHGNTAGILIFKLPNLDVQFSNCHNIHDNVSTNNNHPNFGLGYLELVPQGTGMLFLSNDSGWFHDNTVTGNDTLGFVATDQGALNALNDPDPFSPTSPDYIPTDNFITNNTLTGNGGNPDPNFSGFASDLLVVMSPGSTGNCVNGNTMGTLFGQSLPTCTATQPAGCPFIPPPTTTTTSTTTTTVTVPTTTTTLQPTFTNVYTTILAVRCAGCHDPGNHYAGLDVSTQAGAYTALVNVPSTELPTMDRIEPTDPANSYLQHKVDGDAGSVGGNPSQMPLSGGPLTQAQRDLIRDWILAGAAND